ncbi:MAG: hypothetical protein JW863_12425 [Chitinispirillaceae bacterium]|nr:hypothetical protein [Chitinispirillaceae bacterium]
MNQAAIDEIMIYSLSFGGEECSNAKGMPEGKPPTQEGIQGSTTAIYYENSVMQDREENLSAIHIGKIYQDDISRVSGREAAVNFPIGRDPKVVINCIIFSPHSCPHPDIRFESLTAPPPLITVEGT